MGLSWADVRGGLFVVLVVSELACGGRRVAVGVDCSADVCGYASDAGCLTHPPVCCDGRTPTCGMSQLGTELVQLRLVSMQSVAGCASVPQPLCQ